MWNCLKHQILKMEKTYLKNLSIEGWTKLQRIHSIAWGLIIMLNYTIVISLGLLSLMDVKEHNLAVELSLNGKMQKMMSGWKKNLESITKDEKITLLKLTRINWNVSLIISRDIIKAMQILSGTAVICSNAGAWENKLYVFVSLLQAVNHYSGSQSLDGVSQKLPILKHKINYTKMCQRTSYLKARMNMSETTTKLLPSIHSSNIIKKYLPRGIS